MHIADTSAARTSCSRHTGGKNYRNGGVMSARYGFPLGHFDGGRKVKPENIAYAAKVNAAYHLIRNARKIARRLVGPTREQQQAIENEIVEIGMRLYGETTQEAEPEATHDPGQDHELEACVAAVQELVPDAERWFIINCYHHQFSVGQSAERWQEYWAYLRASKGDE